ncbi:MAG: RraA family protein [Candidatus Dormiibacterota bacterium]
MSTASAFATLSPTTLADELGRAQVMDLGIRPLWAGAPRIAGPAYPVSCPAGDNLMLHAAIHRAPAGSVVVAVAGDCDYAMAGGNVCAIAQRRGIAAFVVDGVIRDLAETRERGFPVFARGVMPVPGAKDAVGVLNGAVTCGGVRVEPGDIVVADEEGVVVVPRQQAEQVLARGRGREANEAAQTLDEWADAHRRRVDEALRRLGIDG